MAKYNYEEGSVFFVPLRTGGYARGLVARCDGRGLVFGYFFGPRFASIPNEVDASHLKACDAILFGQFSDIGLRKGEWPIVARIANWERQLWPMPMFASNAEHEDSMVLTEYDEDTLNVKSVVTKPRSEISANDFPIDRVMGYGSVEKKLTQLLEKGRM